MLAPTGWVDAAPPADTPPTDGESADEPGDGGRTDEDAEPGESPADGGGDAGANGSMRLAEADVDGLTGRWSSEFTVPGASQIEGAAIRLGYVVPELVVDATVSISVNGTFVANALLGDGRETGVIELDVAPEVLRPGRNEIVVRTSVPLAFDGECPAPEHPGRLVTLWLDGVPDVRTSPSVEPPTFEAFPEVLLGAGAESSELIVVVDPTLPAVGSVVDLAADVIAAIAYETDVAISPLVVAPDDAGEPTGPVLDLTGVGAPEEAKLGIERTDAGWPVLRLAGTLDEARVVVDVLAEPTTRSQLGGSAFRGSVDTLDPIPTNDLRAQISSAWTTPRTLADIGYDTIVLEGPGQDRSTIQIDVPTDAFVSRLDIRAEVISSVRPNGETSSLDVFANGRLVGSAALDAQQTLVDVVIDNQALRTGSNSIRFAVDFGESVPTCSTPAPPSGRVEIAATSEVSFERGASVRIDLEGLPQTYRSTTDIRRTTIVTPTSPTTDELGRAIDLAVELGDDGKALNIATPEMPSAGEGQRVLIGTEERQPHLTELAGRLPLGFDPDGTFPDEVQALLPGDARYEGVVGVVSDEGRLMLVASGATDEGVDAALRALLTPDGRRQMSGAAVAVPIDGIEGLVSIAGPGRATSAVEFNTEPVGDEEAADETADDSGEVSADDLGIGVTGEAAEPGRRTFATDPQTNSLRGLMWGVAGSAILLVFGALFYLRRRRAHARGDGEEAVAH